MIDQRRLPDETVELRCETAADDKISALAGGHKRRSSAQAANRTTVRNRTDCTLRPDEDNREDGEPERSESRAQDQPMPPRLQLAVLDQLGVDPPEGHTHHTDDTSLRSEEACDARSPTLRNARGEAQPSSTPGSRPRSSPRSSEGIKRHEATNARNDRIVIPARDFNRVAEHRANCCNPSLLAYKCESGWGGRTKRQRGSRLGRALPPAVSCVRYLLRRSR